MPLTTYTAGEVLTAASLNNNFTFAAANPVGGLSLISATTIGTTVASVTVSSAFSATYDAYKIVISGGVGASNPQLNLTFGSTATGYYYGLIYNNYSGTIAATGGSNSTSIGVAGSATTGGIAFNVDVVNPFLATNTLVASQMFYDAGQIGSTRGYLANTTSYTAFTVTCNPGTLTGGTIRVYGYLNS
jgi:hypothetical protein